MSWSDERPKIVKNAHLLKKFEFTSFDPDHMAKTHDSGEMAKDDTPFVNLGGDTQDRFPEFVPLETQPEINEKRSPLVVDSRQDVLGGKDEDAAAGGDPLGQEALDMFRTQEEMARLKEETCHKCTMLEKEAWEKGFEKGEAAGVEAGEKKALPVLTNINALLTEIADLKSRLLTQYEREILELIFSVSEKIIHCEISLDHRVIQETVLHTLQLASEKEHLVLRLHPEDVHLIEKLQASSADPSGKLTAVSLSADPSVSRGGCHLETPHGDIDASIETRLNRVYKSLIRGFEKGK